MPRGEIGKGMPVRVQPGLYAEPRVPVPSAAPAAPLSFPCFFGGVFLPFLFFFFFNVFIFSPFIASE